MSLCVSVCAAQVTEIAFGLLHVCVGACVYVCASRLVFINPA